MKTFNYRVPRKIQRTVEVGNQISKSTFVAFLLKKKKLQVVIQIDLDKESRTGFNARCTSNFGYLYHL